MLRQIKVADLCNELEKQLEKLQYSEDSMRRYRKVFRTKYSRLFGQSSFVTRCANSLIAL